MKPRKNQHAAMSVDLAVILLPDVGIQEAARMLRRQDVPLAVALRALSTPRRRSMVSPSVSYVV
jgi:hypothetical protein